MKKNQPDETAPQSEPGNDPVSAAADQNSTTQDAVSAPLTPTDAPTGEQFDELTRDLQRVQAEFLNFKRRAEQERSEVAQFARSRVVREFLAVRDSFDSEAQHRPTDIDPAWAASIDSVRAQFDKVLKNLDVERFEVVGQAFDPHLHEAVVMDDGSGKREVVTEELQAGYRQGDTILRHAMVKVGRTDRELA